MDENQDRPARGAGGGLAFARRAGRRAIRLIERQRRRNRDEWGVFVVEQRAACIEHARTQIRTHRGDRVPGHKTQS
ncbi:MAG: hypothetical protein NVS3B27_13960 [Novosphingobium sp.]